jgi:rhodanese-related sulfurtransferase
MEAKTNTISVIGTTTLKAALAAGNRHVWNVLTDEYFKGAMIPGSRRVPLDRIGEEVRHLQLPKNTPIAVYCAGPKCPQSAMAAEKLTKLGYTDVVAYEGGVEEWERAGLPVLTLQSA